ncbi:DUF4168 domain-containing protein [Salinimonas sp. HHU 13199]|uniref:DUF4168 domain-containing protein n=1 Tax=Salinimonas profundi TaxID=2729140 RepID=A0ABR8LRV4_9ALTE|nr:DUF4168 domain-containing protein [Salinimonas profundi]MBD3586865.1 DUF4168 domain-containing protein [Salinimonas profundi]
MNKFVKTFAASAVIACASFTAQAQEASSQSMQQSSEQQQMAKYDDATLLKFTMAMEAVSNVANKYDPKFKEVESPEKAQKIQKQAQAEMVDEIEKTGLTVEKYTTIAQRVQTDETLRERVLTIAREKQQENS